MYSWRKETSPRAFNKETDHLELGSEGGQEAATVKFKKAESQSMPMSIWMKMWTRPQMLMQR